MEKPSRAQKALNRAIDAAGGLTALTRALNERSPITIQAVTQWNKVSIRRARDVSEITGVALCDLRPDVWSAEDLELIAWATEIQQDAARKAGAILRDREMATGGNPHSEIENLTPPSEVGVKTLADLGITYNQSSRWQALAALDDEAFEARKAAASRAAVASVERTREERNADKKARRGEREADLGARVAAQDGVCAICKTVGRGKNSTRLHIDHDHNTGKVRALLCFQCNVGLGKFKDNSELLLAAAHYIERFTCESS